MAGFEIGEKLTCLDRVVIDKTAYQPGEDFPYENLKIDIALVESLLNQRKIIREAMLTQAMKDELLRDKTPKKIRNNNGVRVAVSWPEGEDLPEGVVRPDGYLPKVEDDNSTADGLVTLGRGWFNVFVDGKQVNEKKLREKEALELLNEGE